MIGSTTLYTLLPLRQSNPAQTHSRCMHLIHQMMTKYPVLEQLDSIMKKNVPSSDQIYLRLYDIQDKDLGIMTLPEALERIEPHFHLSQRVSGSTHYQIRPLRLPTKEKLFATEWEKGGRGNKAFARAGRSKDMPLKTVVTPSHLHQILSAAYEDLIRGARVEFRLGRRTCSSDRIKTLDWALINALHLRPDTILAAMPPGTTTLAQPCYVSGRENVMMWALEYAPALKEARASTPAFVKRMGTWDDHSEVMRVLHGRKKGGSPIERTNI